MLTHGACGGGRGWRMESGERYPADEGKGLTLKIRGFARGALTDEGTGAVHMGDWHENTITNLGFQNYIVANILHATTSQYPYAIAIGSGASSWATDTTALASEHSDARCVATTSIVASKTLRMVASWAATANTGTIAAAAVHYNSSVSTGSAGSLVNFTSSVKSSTQTFSLTYDWVFA